MSQHPLSITRRCALLDVPRSSAYHRPVAASERDSILMRLMDEIHLRWPFYGSRRMCDALADEGHVVNRKCVQRLMRTMGMNALYPGPNTSRAQHAHKVYPYRLRGLAIERANQVWCADVTYIPMARGFIYLVAVMDWYSRKVPAWRLSNTLDADFCVEALNAALSRHGAPEIFNTDQGCQFTSAAFIERLWRSLKYEEVYLHAYDSVRDARVGVRRWIDFYNQQRKHQALDRRTPDNVYYTNMHAQSPMGDCA